MVLYAVLAVLNSLTSTYETEARAGSADNEFSVVATELIGITTDIETILQTAMSRPT